MTSVRCLRRVDVADETNLLSIPVKNSLILLKISYSHSEIAGAETSGAEKSWEWKVLGLKRLGGEVLGVKHLGGEKSRGEKIWGWKVLGVKSLGGEKSWGWKVLGVKSLGGERSWGWNSRYEKSGAETSRAEQSCSPKGSLLKCAFLRSGSQLMIWGAILEEFVNKVLSFSRKEFGWPGVWTRDLLHVKPVC